MRLKRANVSINSITRPALVMEKLYVFCEVVTDLIDKLLSTIISFLKWLRKVTPRGQCVTWLIGQFLLKAKVNLSLSKPQRGGTAPLIPDLAFDGFDWSHSHACCGTHWTASWVDSRAGLSKRANLFPVPGIEPRSFGCPSRSLVTTTSLYRLGYLLHLLLDCTLSPLCIRPLN